MDLVCKFTQHSVDPNNYNKIHANLRTPFTQYSTLVIDSLTTNCCIEVLNPNDYIVVNDVLIHFNESYSSLNSETVSNLLNDLLSNANIAVTTYVDNTNRINFVSNNSFTINDCSYNVSQILGLYDVSLPLTSVLEDDKYELRCVSVGHYLSTPILYLLATIGEKCFINDSANRKILMRINNSYSANFPVISNNAEFSTYCLSNDFSDITFELVDANFKPVKLLSPMYLCGTITGDPKAETINTSRIVTPEMIGNVQSNQSLNES